MVGVEAPTLRDSIEYALAPQFFGAAPHQSVRFTVPFDLGKVDAIPGLVRDLRSSASSTTPRSASKERWG